MSDPNKKWVGYADLLEAKRKREEREAQAYSSTEDGLVIEASQARETSLVTDTSQVTQTRQVNSTIKDRPEASQVKETRQVTQASQLENSVNLMASLPDVKGHTRVHHQLIDHLYPQLDAYEQAAHLHLYRLSWGYNKPNCTISLQKLADRAGLSYKSAQRAVNSLVQRGLVRRQGRVVGYGKDQGIDFWVAPAPSQATETSQVKETRQVTEGTNKEKALKENLKRESTPLDYKNCPDCNGSGFWYPEGVEKGVAKCKHVKLVSRAE